MMHIITCNYIRQTSSRACEVDLYFTSAKTRKVHNFNGSLCRLKHNNKTRNLYFQKDKGLSTSAQNLKAGLRCVVTYEVAKVA